ncbi:MAG: hypothetical protein MZV70_15010 [Desulfobacterales bacterium]|nr:hypothetical protein [Desulfobacterales bacterium]
MEPGKQISKMAGCGNIWPARPWPSWAKYRKSALKNIKEKVSINVERIDEIEKTTKHDVIAFLTSLDGKSGRRRTFYSYGHDFI